MFRFLYSPRWLVGHVLVVIIVAVCVSLGMWQLRRLDDRRELNALIEQRSTLEAVPIQDLLPLDQSDAWRPVTVSGEWLESKEVVLRGRSLGSQPGNHVLTPMKLSSGQILIVDRGWVPLGSDRPPVKSAKPSRQTASVEGFLVASEGPTLSSDDDRSTGPSVDAVGRIDIKRLSGQLPAPLLGYYLVAQKQEPPQSGGRPTFATLPERDEGPHKSYAIQWFIFAPTALIVYWALIRKTALQRRV